MGWQALKDINLNIKRCEFLALIGQNGSGKTTLIKHMNGLLKASKGSIKVGGELVENQAVSDMAHYIGYVFQNPAHQIFADSVEKEIAFGPQNLEYDDTKVKELVDKALKDVGLEEYRDAMPFMLGRGQQQRLAVASILSMDPKVLIIDEPTTGLDWGECVRVMELVKKLNEAGHTIIMTTHNMNLVQLYAKRVVVLCKGEILADGPTEEVFRESEKLKRAYIKPPQVFRLMSEFPELDIKDYSIDAVADAIVSKLGKETGNS